MTDSKPFACTTDRRMFEIACSFPALKFKGVEDGHIPGISLDDFHDGFCPIIFTTALEAFLAAENS